MLAKMAVHWHTNPARPRTQEACRILEPPELQEALGQGHQAAVAGTDRMATGPLWYQGKHLVCLAHQVAGSTPAAADRQEVVVAEIELGHWGPNTV